MRLGVVGVHCNAAVLAPVDEYAFFGDVRPRRGAERDVDAEKWFEDEGGDTNGRDASPRLVSPGAMVSMSAACCVGNASDVLVGDVRADRDRGRCG